MTHSPCIWFLSHRTHYDPRIYHIMSVFRALGWHTVLFDPAPEQYGSLEWAELVDTPWEPLAAPIFTRCDIDALAPKIVRWLLHFVAKSEVVSYAEKGIEKASHGISFQVIKEQSGLCVAFGVTGQPLHYVYELSTQHLYVARIRQDAVHMLAIALADALKRGADFSTLSKQILLPDDYVLEAKDGFYLLSCPAGYEHGHEIMIDIHTYMLRERVTPRRYHYADDDFGGRRFEYAAFKNEVYGYIWELDTVRDYLSRPDANLPNVVFVSDLPTLPIGAMLKDIYGCKLIVDCHEWWSEQERIWNPDAEQKIASIDRWEKALYQRCDAAMTVSKSLAAEMSTYFGMRFHYVPTCVFELPDIPERREIFWKSHANIPEGSSVILFQGGFSTNRNLETLMRATRYLHDNQYLVVCGDGAIRTELEAILAKEGNPAQVRMLGWKKQLELWEYTLNADVGIIPYSNALRYYRLSAPNKLSEYHVCQLPMLVDSGMIELTSIVIDDGVGRCADFSSAESMGVAIAEMLADSDALSNYREAYKKAIKRFTRAQCRVYMDSIIQEL